MNNRYLIVGILVFLVLASATVVVFAFQEKPADSESAQKARTVKEIKLKGDFEKEWAVNASGELITSLVSDNDAVFYSAHGVTALDAETGSTLWESKAFTGAAPIIAAEGTVIGTDPDGMMIALDSVTGREKWRAAAGEQSTSAAISGKRVLYSNRTGIAVALDKETGQEIWRSRISEGNVHASVSTATEGETMFVLSSDGFLHNYSVTAISAVNGAVLWTRFINDSSASICTGPGKVFLLSQTSAGPDMPTHVLVTLDATDGSVKWQSNIYSQIPPVINFVDGRLYFGSFDANGAALHGLDPASGIEQWSCRPETRSSVPAAFAVKDGMVYLNDLTEIYAADAENGKIWWNVKPGGPLMVPPVVADDSVCFAYGSAGTLYALPLLHL